MNHWTVSIPVGPTTVTEDGVCTVILDGDGLILRNDVHFDRSALLRALEAEAAQ